MVHQQQARPVPGAVDATYPRRQFLLYQQVISGQPLREVSGTGQGALEEPLTFAQWFAERDRRGA